MGAGGASERILHHYHNGQEWVFGVCLWVWMDQFDIATKPENNTAGRQAGLEVERLTNVLKAVGSNHGADTPVCFYSKIKRCDGDY